MFLIDDDQLCRNRMFLTSDIYHVMMILRIIIIIDIRIVTITITITIIITIITITITIMFTSTLSTMTPQGAVATSSTVFISFAIDSRWERISPRFNVPSTFLMIIVMMMMMMMMMILLPSIVPPVRFPPGENLTS